MPLQTPKDNKFVLDPAQRYGRGYSRIINCRKRYLVLKGGIASKKSWNIAERWIELLTQFPESNLLVVRRFAVLNQNSTYSELKKAIHRMHLDGLWRSVKSPMEIRNRQTGQKILFRGCDDPDSLASITVDIGVLNFVWIEEAFQLERKEMFDRIDDRIRGKLPFDYFAQIVMTFNPWNEKHWMNETFFQLNEADVLDESQVKYVKGQQIETQSRLAITTNYKLNEFLSEMDLMRFEEMRINQPQRYKVAGLGHWGVIGQTVYENWQVLDFNWRDLFFRLKVDGKPLYKHKIGLDFGYSASFAAVGLLVDEEAKEIYVYDEIYDSRISNDERYNRLVAKGWQREPVHCDSNVPEELEELKKKGCPRFFGVSKPKGSVTSGIQKIRGYKIFVHPRCENFIIEISHYQFKQDQFGKELPAPKKEWDHLMDAMRYAMTDEKVGTTVVVTSQEQIEGERLRLERFIKKRQGEV
nr:MAG: terminase large subunit [Caudoviricetes sp.]